MQCEVLGLVSERVDVRAGMLRRDDDARRACARLSGAASVVTVEEVVEARRVGGMRGRALIPELFEVEDAGRLEALE
jgi:uncharacterized heparinase superfamily protein